jgi:DNA polymerase delta subunit 3
MADSSKYLATEILSEQRTLSYRNVARAQKVHANTAKCMLYEFYDDQTKRKPGSLYATYLIAGVKRREKPAQNGTNGVHDDDEPVPSSPPPFSSSMLQPSQHDNEETVPRKTITLVREESLEGRKTVSALRPRVDEEQT